MASEGHTTLTVTVLCCHLLKIQSLIRQHLLAKPMSQLYCLTLLGWTERGHMYPLLSTVGRDHSLHVLRLPINMRIQLGNMPRS